MYKVLIVDDESLIRKNIEFSIDYEHLPLTVCGLAKNGLEASELVISQDPDIIITDIKMPVIDGIALIHELKENNIEKKVIVISGYDDYEYLRPALTYGSVDYICKPLDPQELNRALLTAVGELNREREAQRREESMTAQIEQNRAYLLEHFFTEIAQDRLRSQKSARRWTCSTSVRSPPVICASRSDAIPLPICPRWTSIALFCPCVSCFQMNIQAMTFSSPRTTRTCYAA